MAEEKRKPVILVTNDDGIMAPGIHNLVNAVKDLGTVVVVAPDKPQSGMGHAITVGEPLRLTRTDRFEEGVESYSCSGTPVDCVKLAVDKILNQPPDLCLSGINHGSNHSINVLYSGTMSAAMEACIENIPSIGFSLLDYRVEADFSASVVYAKKIVESFFAGNLPEKNLLLNVNIPAVPLELLRGVKVCRQAYGKYDEDFDERMDPHGRKYYWLTGQFRSFDDREDTDAWALDNHYISVVPVQFDLTNYKLKKELEDNWNVI